MAIKLNKTITEFNIVIAGVGGQGTILLSHIIGNAAIKEGYSAKVAETYGASIRGGAVLGQIRIGTDILNSLIPEDSADIILALEPMEGLRVGVKYLAADGMAIVNTKPLTPMVVNIGKAIYPNVIKMIEYLRKLCKEVLSLNASKLAEKAGSSRTLNTVMLGALTATGILPISTRILRETIQEHVPKGTEDINLRAFELGSVATQKQLDMHVY